jgi:hypothetical protein
MKLMKLNVKEIIKILEADLGPWTTGGYTHHL